jgi:hypothetical protein
MSSEADQASRMRDDAGNPRNGIDGKLACITKCLKNGDGGLARASPSRQFAGVRFRIARDSPEAKRSGPPPERSISLALGESAMVAAKDDVRGFVQTPMPPPPIFSNPR